MQVVSFPARQARTHYRHELRTLTYVTLDTANGGIIRNLNSEGVAVQAVAPLRQHQRVRLRFELRFPRLRIETYGQVRWSSPSGQCGIRFVDLPVRTSRGIGEWIFSNLLDSLVREPGNRPIFQGSRGSISQAEVTPENAPAESGLILSSYPRPSIRPESSSSWFERTMPPQPHQAESLTEAALQPDLYSNWLSRPISARTLAWLVDALIMIAGLLLFTLIFLAITHELPSWPVTLGIATVAALFVAGAYWALFALFGGASLGARLAQAVSCGQEEVSEGDRFR
ncbi:MAG TPA: PilZ domain-containing protein [Candidatus Sulfotelmatobacter sp.]|nr:PilZ domain-containing protein [Candidatus Sulfotelmatobacter sp.]